MKPKIVNGKLTGFKTNYYVDKDLKVLLGSVRKKTWALVVMLFATGLFVSSHVKHDLAQEKEIRSLLKYISHLEKQTSIYCQRIKKLERNKHICMPP
jgi:hypothetical protein